MTGWVQLWDRNRTEKPLPNPPWTSYRKASVPAPPKPDPLAKYLPTPIKLSPFPIQTVVSLFCNASFICKASWRASHALYNN